VRANEGPARASSYCYRVPSLAFACPNPSCGRAIEGTLARETREMRCPACGRAAPLPEAASIAETGAVPACPVCGSTDVYQQRDFNRRVGIALVAMGVVTGPFTHWISTVAFVVLDAALYLLVSPVAICYACEAQVRGFDRAKSPPAFDIAVHDLYRFGKRFPPRREAAVAGPRSRLVAREAERAAR
jgi:hypothetical protein